MLSSDSIPIPSNIKDLTNQRFGRLFVVRFAHTRKHLAYWGCLCDCGTYKTTSGAHLRSGHIRSCGCLYREKSAKINYLHGCSSKKHRHRYLYELWLGIRSRVLDPSDISYSTYGGRGVPMEEDWKTDSASFIRDILKTVGERPSAKHSIDRIENARGYVRGNLRWLTPYEQNRNKTTNRNITANGETLCITDWAKRLGRSPRAIAARIERFGWSPENAVTSNSKNK